MAEDPYERADFVNLLVRSFRQCSKGTLPTLIGLPSDDYSSSFLRFSPGSLVLFPLIQIGLKPLISHANAR